VVSAGLRLAFFVPIVMIIGGWSHRVNQERTERYKIPGRMPGAIRRGLGERGA